MTIIKSRAATLAETIPSTPKRCPSCNSKVGTKFIELNTGRPEARTTVGWRCTQCGADHELAEPDPTRRH